MPACEHSFPCGGSVACSIAGVVTSLTNTAASSARLYSENNNNFNAVEQKTAEVSIPIAVTVLPEPILDADAGELNSF
jgi:hypothetical protein